VSVNRGCGARSTNSWTATRDPVSTSLCILITGNFVWRAPPNGTVCVANGKQWVVTLRMPASSAYLASLFICFVLLSIVTYSHIISLIIIYLFMYILYVKAIPVTGPEGPQGCETSRLPHIQDNPLTDGGEVVSPTRRPPFTPRKIPGTHFC
jgi:hypothetical protein